MSQIVLDQGTRFTYRDSLGRILHLVRTGEQIAVQVHDGDSAVAVTMSADDAVVITSTLARLTSQALTRGAA